MKPIASFILLLLLSSCVQVGGQSQPQSPIYQGTASAQSSGGTQLSVVRASGEHYTQVNATQNQHLPKGKPYTVRGETYVPYTSAEGFTEIGIASWYGPGFHGKTTANGERYNQNDMTAAHKLLPFGTIIKVTNLENGKTCVVRINDRGPFLHGRVIDLSNKAAKVIDMIDAGTAKVKLDVAGSASAASTPQYSPPTPQYSPPPSPQYAPALNYTPQTYAAPAPQYNPPTQTYATPTPQNILPTQTYAPIQTPQISRARSSQNTEFSNNAHQLYLHLRVYASYSNSQKALRILTKGGVNAQIYKDHGMYFVHTGPYRTLQEATKDKNRLQKHFPKSYYVLR